MFFGVFSESRIMNSGVESHGGNISHRHINVPYSQNYVLPSSPEVTRNDHVNASSSVEDRSDLPSSPPRYEEALGMPSPSVPQLPNHLEAVPLYQNIN